MTLDRRRTHRYLLSGDAQRQLERIIAGEVPPPLDVVVHFNNYCNHMCDFCSNDVLVGQGRRISVDANKMASLLDEFSDIGIRHVIVSGGGEPLTHPKREFLLGVIQDQEYDRTLYSNLDLEVADIMEALSSFSGVHVNVNVTDEDQYRKIRGGRANLSRVRTNISMLLGAGVPVTATVVVRDNTAAYLSQTIDDLVSWGVFRINVSPAFTMRYADKVCASMRTLRVMEELQGVRDDVRLLEPERFAVKDGSGRTYCRSHQFTVTIGADLKLYPCCSVSYDKSHTMLDLHTYDTFYEAWLGRATWNGAGCERCWLAPVNEELYRLGK